MALRNDAQIETFWMGDRSRKIMARIVVEGNLQLCTPAHFGNGDSSDATDLPLLTDALDDRLPLLTGTSLAGALRAYLGRVSVDVALEKALFGGVRKQRSDDELQSPMIVDDALGKQATVELRDSVKLDPKTRTAKDGALFNLDTWAAGTLFPLRLELVLTEKHDPQKAMQALAAALTGLSNGSITLGARKQRGYGEVRVDSWRIRRYNLADKVNDLLDWLAHGNDLLGDSTTVVETRRENQARPDREVIISLLKAFGASADPTGKDVVEIRADNFKISATFALEGSLMIRGSTGKDDLEPDMVHLHLKQTGGAMQPVIPGTSLAGALRARAFKIACTLGSQSQADKLVGDMFGPEIKENVDPKASRVIVSDSVIEKAETDLVQNRIRIDRFTGGVVEGALFNEKPVFAKSDTQVTLRWQLRDPLDAEIGLLLLLLKDLWTGDLPVGGEIGIGRGRLKGKSANLVHNSKDGATKHWHLQEQGGKLDVSGDSTADQLDQYVKTHLMQWLQRIQG